MMLREEVAARLRERREEDGYLLPDYGGHCFAGVPHTVADLLGAETGPTLPDDVLAGVDTDPGIVLVALIDGFGLDGWRRERGERPLLGRLTERGRVTPLTSIYPSETAAAITTFHTGALPASHGVIGWNVYDPRADVAFTALPHEVKTGTGEIPPRGEVADADPLYPALAAAGIDTHHVVPFEGSTEGVTSRTYEGLGDAGTTLASTLDAAEPPAYVYAYFPHVDAAAHDEGTASDAYRGALAGICEELSGVVAGLDRRTAAETLVIATADHGHIDTDPARNVDLSAVDAVEAGLRRHADGTPVRFAGSPRNVHLHLEPGAVAEVRETLRGTLDARVFRGEEVIDRGLCGPDPSETFRRRLGDLVVTHRDLGVWWGREREELEMIGMHGGLSPAEMLVPFAAAPATALR